MSAACAGLFGGRVLQLSFFRGDPSLYLMMNELEQQIEAILNGWDPIGVMEIAPRDEYHHYIPWLVELVEAGKGEAFFYNHLVVVVQAYMYGPGHGEHTRRAARKLAELASKQ
jgi:hypothetical protein